MKIMRNFKELLIWQKGIEIATLIFRLASSFPKEEKYGLRSQLTSAAVSIPSNIAEGSSRLSIRENHRFLEISLGSSYELETQLLIAKAVNVGEKLLIEIILNLNDQEQKMLLSYMNKLRTA